MTINTVFKVGEIVRLTILDKRAEGGQWFETTVTGTSSKSGILLNLEGFVLEFSGNKSENIGGFVLEFSDNKSKNIGLAGIIERGCRFDPGSQRFCFYSKWYSEDDDDRRWDEFKATLELSVWNRFAQL